jgi:putative FmdB family regulatory protein
MPTYEYACKSCDEHVEVVQSFKDDPVTECPACGGPLRKVFGSIGISFKGSGFYKTDSRKADSVMSSASTSSSADKAGTSGEKSSSTAAAATSTPSSSPSSSSSSSSSSDTGKKAAS